MNKGTKAFIAVAAGVGIGINFAILSRYHHWELMPRMLLTNEQRFAIDFARMIKQEQQKLEAQRLREQRPLLDDPALRQEMKKLLTEHQHDLDQLPALNAVQKTFANCSQDKAVATKLKSAEYKLTKFDYEVMVGLRAGPYIRDEESRDLQQHRVKNYLAALDTCK